MTNKRFGRVGDSPIIGAGTYADSRACAISGTGEGEYFIRLALAKSICMKAGSSDFDFKTAVMDTIDGDLTALGGLGGVIALAPDGEIIMYFNTTGMYRGSVSSQEDAAIEITVKLYQSKLWVYAH